jgi:hypothetical protein
VKTVIHIDGFSFPYRSGRMELHAIAHHLGVLLNQGRVYLGSGLDKN